MHYLTFFFSERGCPAAVLRIWTDIGSPGKELCGEKPVADRWEFVSTSNQMRLR